MRRTRQHELERRIVEFLKLKKQHHPNSHTIAAKVGGNIEHVRLALMDLSTEGVTWRSRKGRYRLRQRHADALKRREIWASSG